MNSLCYLVLFLGSLVVSITTCDGARKVVVNLELAKGSHLVIREGEDVCSLIVNKWMKGSFQGYSNITLQAFQTEVMQKLVVLPVILAKINLKENLFLDCTSSFLHSSMCTRQTYKESWKVDRSKVLNKLLELLRKDQSFVSEKLSVSNFIRQYEDSGLKTTSREAIVLFASAYTLFPNNSFLINRFGQSLDRLNQSDIRNSLYENAVKNGVWPSKIQRPELDYTIGLSAYPWHNSSNFPFTQILEDNYETFKSELTTLLLSNASMFGRENENLNNFNGGDWTGMVIKSSMGYSSFSSLLPQTTEILQSIDEEFHLIKYSALRPGTHIQPHTGPSNKRLRTHFCIVHTGGAQMRVGNTWQTWQEGKVLVLDSSYEHEVIHNGHDLRVVLILDIWHPEYSKHRYTQI